MKKALVLAVVAAGGLMVNGTVQAGGQGGSGSHSHNSSSSGSSSSYSTSTKNTTSSYSKNTTNTSQGNGNSKNAKGFTKNTFVKSCKSPGGKWCGSGWCFPHNSCTSWSR